MRRHYRQRRKRKSDDTSNALRLLLLSFLVLLAVIFKTVTGVGAMSVFKEISSVITGEQTYSEAVSSLGRSIYNGANENALVVFGKSLIGQKENDEVKQSKEKEPPTVDKLPKEVEETKKQDKITVTPAINKELEIKNVEFMDNEEEYIDDTLDEPFEMPTPDIVDNNKYTLPFKYTRPVKGRITSPFGYRVHPVSNETTFHYGIDLAAGKGTEVSAIAKGRVIERGTGRIFGNYVKIEHDNGFLSFYAHLSKISVKRGETVKLGQKIGLAGDTGIATGPHLHFEIRKNGKVTDPSQYIK